MYPYQSISKPHKLYLPILHTPQTYTYQPSNLYPKPMLNMDVIYNIKKINILFEPIFILFLKYSKNSINRASGSRRFTTARV